MLPKLRIVHGTIFFMPFSATKRPQSKALSTSLIPAAQRKRRSKLQSILSWDRCRLDKVLQQQCRSETLHRCRLHELYTDTRRAFYMDRFESRFRRRSHSILINLFKRLSVIWELVDFVSSASHRRIYICTLHILYSQSKRVVPRFFQWESWYMVTALTIRNTRKLFRLLIW